MHEKLGVMTRLSTVAAICSSKFMSSRILPGQRCCLRIAIVSEVNSLGFSYMYACQFGRHFVESSDDAEGVDDNDTDSCLVGKEKYK